jgi:predicted nucleic acid-binding protein
MIVVDASVAVTWLVTEQGPEDADHFLTAPSKIFAPDLIRVEVAAALTRRFRTALAPEAEVREDCARWSRMLADGILNLTPVDEDYEDAVASAMQLKHPYQDCLYLALAQRSNIPLVTADPKSIERVARRYTAVRPLFSYRDQEETPLRTRH